ncbi:MAG: DUF3604 domain-containing protein [Polyangiaceae bacterium]|nr:DUF3604 domain-containing protein [Polyangiaceae bacterium]
MRRRWFLLGVPVALGAGLTWTYAGGRHEAAGTPQGAALPASAISARIENQRSLQDTQATKQILFGDLHVHSTFSPDAFMMTLPFVGGEGAHPPADACDFARYCSGLDFFSINDHAEGITPAHWQETKEAIRQCNALAGDPENPDLVAFVGWEWTQVGLTPETHYGHKNVIFRDLADDKLPARPIAAIGQGAQLRRVTGQNRGALLLPLIDFDRRQRYLDLAVYMRELRDTPTCTKDVDTRQLPEDCLEETATPGELFAKLNQWGFPHLVIPHGTTWGFYTPAGYTWDKQLAPEQDDESQRLLEVYSGHGNSEEYRDQPSVIRSPEDPQKLVCPESSPGFEPCCQRAGELVRARCADQTSKACEQAVSEAKQNYLAAGMSGHLTLPWAEVTDWGECDQCTDCFNPAFSSRPGGSAQYILAKTHFGKATGGDAAPKNAQLGFIASSDNHSAQPGTGYKEFGRRKFTEARGPESAKWRDRLFDGVRSAMEKQLGSVPTKTSIQLTSELRAVLPPFALPHLERQASFFLTGGLVAVHSAGRNRTQIWDALERREVYGTSGDRILLWFDLMPQGKDLGEALPMGSASPFSAIPSFRVRAAGSLEELPGCPAWSKQALGDAELERLCRGECHNPGSKRKRIREIQIVRIRPQQRPDEPMRELIEDPWKRVACPADKDTCEVSFEDPDYVVGRRDVVYYVRAVQEPTPAVNAGNVRCERDASGKCIKANPCYGDYRTDPTDDCLTPNQERAWSSPIFLHYVDPPPSADADAGVDADAGDGAAGVDGATSVGAR